ncbi:MAG: DNA ligase [Kofleriaceae bacterium]|nr:DNA ligase [Kofleriaceae bacterium]
MGATLDDGDEVEVQGSSGVYTLSRKGDVYMCSCPAWRNQGAVIDRRTCKHLRKYLGDAEETARVGSATPARAAATGGRAQAVKKDTAPPILLAHKWETDHDPKGWWMSEKLDGVRAYWDGEGLISRLGNRFPAPTWFTDALPKEKLDGELWIARKQFQRTSGVVRSGGVEWTSVAYVVFDAPEIPGTFEERLAAAKTLIETANVDHLRMLDQVLCEGVAHLRAELARVEGLGGEGLMLREPGSAYTVGRSTTLLKVKTFHDAEARVIGHAPGAGKHKGRLGALVCQLPDGVTFNVGTGFSDAERETPPAIGAVISFRYQELTEDGVPRFPSYVGERHDVDLPAAPPPLGTGTKKLNTDTRPTKIDRPITPGIIAMVAEKVERDPHAPVQDPRPATVFVALPPKLAPQAEQKTLYRERLEHEDGKFWEIEVRGSSHITRFGKIGTSGQIRMVDSGTPEAAKSEAEKRAAQKKKEGYRAAKLSPET